MRGQPGVGQPKEWVRDVGNDDASARAKRLSPGNWSRARRYGLVEQQCEDGVAECGLVRVGNYLGDVVEADGPGGQLSGRSIEASLPSGKLYGRRRSMGPLHGQPCGGLAEAGFRVGNHAGARGRDRRAGNCAIGTVEAVSAWVTMQVSPGRFRAWVTRFEARRKRSIGWVTTGCPQKRKNYMGNRVRTPPPHRFMRE